MHIFVNRNPKAWTLFLSSVCSLMLFESCQGTTLPPHIQRLYLVPDQCMLGVWFGPKCELKCNCAEGSPCERATGHCQLGCHQGWFGPSCQYRIARVSLPTWASDDDPKTCQKNVSEPIIADLSVPMSLSWLQLGSKSADDFNRVKVEYWVKTKPGETDTSKTCPTIPLAPGKKQAFYTREIFCPEDKEVTKIMIRNEGKTSLCSIEVSLGRNLALKQSIFSASPTIDDKSANRLVSSSTQSCLASTDFPIDVKMYLPLDHERPITMIYLILHMAKECCKDISQFFKVKVYSKDYGQQSLKPQSRYKLDTNVQIAFVPPPKKSITLVTVENLKMSADLFLCQIEAFGDCPRGTYGAKCELSCDCLDDARCSPTGLCPGMCPPGFKGTHCNKTCSVTRYGPDCRMHCSPFCKRDKCDPVNGICLEGCEHGFLLPYCRTKAAMDEQSKDEKKGGGTLKDLNRVEKMNEKLKTTIYAISTSAGALFLMLMVCTLYVVTPGFQEPRTSAPADFDLDDPNFEYFLGYDDIKRIEAERKSSWGSDVCVIGDDDLFSTTGTLGNTDSVLFPETTV